MDDLALRTTQLKTQTVKLNLEDKEIGELNSERAVMKAYVSDVSSLLSNLLQAHDSVLTISFCTHLDEKLLP